MALLLVALPFALACESESLKPDPRVDDAALYWGLELDHHAIALSMVAPYNTITITATPQNYRHEPLAGLPAPQYSSTDIGKVVVTPEGVVRAVAPGSQTVAVVATLTVGNLQRSDTVFIKVTTDNPPPVLGSLTIHPTPPDSSKRGALVQDFLGLKPNILTPRVVDTAGTMLSNLPVYFRTSDSSIVRINRSSGQLVGGRPGEATLYASMTAYGVTKTDTLAYRIGLPIVGTITISRVVPVFGGIPVNAFFPSELRVGTGAIVLWTTNSAQIDTTDVVFTDGTDLPNVRSANTWGGVSSLQSPFIIPLLCALALKTDCNASGTMVIGPPSQGALRVFTAPGTYEYQSTRHGTSGRIIVVDER